jgi:2-keto-4-pentenoate hydratase
LRLLMLPWFSVNVIPNVAVEAARRLRQAETEGFPCAPVRDLIGDTDVDLAYQVQEHNLALKLDAGARLVGRKIGLTSQAVQRQLGVDQPDYGALLDSMVVPDEGSVLVHRVLQPRIEAEVAFRLARDLTSSAPSSAEVEGAVECMYPALEIVGSRIAGWDIRITDTIADNGSSGLFVLGGRAVSLDEVRPVDVAMELSRHGEVVSAGSGRACLGDPLLALQWLARAAVAVGRPLRAGEVILSGALGPMVAVSAGDVFSAEISGLGSVEVSFAPAEKDVAV